MPYGIDTDAFEYVTDAAGKRTKALVPVSTLNALVEFWCAARRAQSEAHELREKPHLRPAPLRVMHQAATDDEGATPASDAGRSKSDEHWQKLIERLPEAPAIASPPAPLASPALIVSPAPEEAGSKKKPPSRQTFFAREFIAPIPDEVDAMIKQGIYFIRAWRLYRKLTVHDVGDLIGKTRDAAGFHEYGYNPPRARTLQAYALAFDCTLEQLTVKPGSNTAPFLHAVERKREPKPKEDIEPRAPEDTEYPEAVRAHLIDGKSPLTAWRLYRRLTLAKLGEQYGATAANIKTLEECAYLKPRTIGKLMIILHCTRDQLLRPEGLEHHERVHESPASRRITGAAMRASA